jgi:sortase A
MVLVSIPEEPTLIKTVRLQSVTGFFGELLITAGALIGLFLVWHLFINDFIQGEEQSNSALSVAQEWQMPNRELLPPDESGLPSTDTPPVTISPEPGEAFALLYVPRFGDYYVRTIAEGVDEKTVLNTTKLGVGHYSQSSQLGELGNFALAGHRKAFGGSFEHIGELRLGDKIYVEVEAGWHSYAFRNLEYVWETDTKVLNLFPKLDVQSSTARVITLTSCNPKFAVSERIIAYGVYEGWYPREGGPPNEIYKIVKGTK